MDEGSGLLHGGRGVATGVDPGWRSTRETVPVTLSVGDYDRTRPLLNGAVQPEGIALRAETGEIGEFCNRPVYEEYDAAEMSLSWYVMARSRREQSERQGGYDPSASYEVRAFDTAYRHGDGQEWLARIYQPQGPGPFPAMLEVHGGAWNRGSRLNNELIDRTLASCGLVVAAIDFRLAPQHPYPAQVQDTNYATRWLKARAREFNADPAQVGGLGSSSGGHTIMLSAMRPADPSYSAIPLEGTTAYDASLSWLLLLWPVLDPYIRYGFAKRTKAEQLVKSTENYFLSEEGMKEGNPQTILDRSERVDLPPSLIIQGTADANVPMEIPERFTASYRKAGGHVEIEIFPDMPHGFASRPGPQTGRAHELAKAFVRRQVNVR